MHNSFNQYLEFIHKALNEIETTQLEKIDEICKIFAECIANDGVIHMYGSGHSRMAVEEMFPRYGSYPGFQPIVELSTTFYQQVVGTNGIRQSMFIENVEGLAQNILKSINIKPNDCFLLYTTSGTGNVVIDMAIEAKKRGHKVIGVTSFANCEVGISKHSTGKKLNDVADILLDNCAPIGDAVVHFDSSKFPVGPASTFGNTLLVNLMKVRTAELLNEMGKLPPVITHAHYIGKEESTKTFDDVLAEFERRQKR